MATKMEIEQHIQVLEQEISDITNQLDQVASGSSPTTLDGLMELIKSRDTRTTALVQAKKNLAGAVVEGERGLREQAAHDMAEDAGSEGFKATLAGHLALCEVVYDAVRDEVGFGTATLRAVIPQAAMDIFHELLADNGVADISSAGRVIVTLKPGETEVKILPTVQRAAPKAVSTPKPAPATNGARGKSGRGWQKDGIVLTMQAAFAGIASAEEQANLDSLGSNSKKDAYKRLILKKSGYSLID